MKVLSVNLAQPRTIIFEGRAEQTGIYKSSVDQPIYLDHVDVHHDQVIDRIHHGGVDKACYLYGFNHYPFWQERYPELSFKYGMFGENITIDVLDESKLRIGDQYKIGTAVIQVAQPRQPCHKLGVRFNDQKMVYNFQQGDSPGVYVRVLQPGTVSSGDKLTLINSDDQAPTVLEIYRMLFARTASELNSFPLDYFTYEALPARVKEKFKQKLVALGMS